MLIKLGSGVILFLPLQHMQLNLPPVISPPSVSAVNMKPLLLCFRCGFRAGVKLCKPCQGHTPTSLWKQRQHQKKKSPRVEHENTVGPLTRASTLGCVLASDALIQALKYANFCLCCRIWVNFPPFVRVMEACRIEHTGLNYRVVKHHNHHR